MQNFNEHSLEMAIIKLFQDEKNIYKFSFRIS